MNKFALFILIFISVFQLKSQCFEIESVLADACNGTPCSSSATEGENEMVRFKVGAVSLNASNLTVIWPATAAGGNQTPWRAIETSTVITAPIIAAINSSITSCGYLKQPVGGVLPAGKQVILITSTDMCTQGNSFANLSDTIYVIFQKSGNTQGHFTNYNSTSGLRTLTMTFSSPSGCSDVVSYDRALLTTSSGNVGAGDGASVAFTPAGIVTYFNNGCEAPIIPLTVDAGPNKSICENGTQSFTATTTGLYTSVNWALSSSATGSLTSINTLTTSYIPAANESGAVKLYCTVNKSCGGSLTTSAKDSVYLTITSLPTLSINNSSVSLCAGQSATLTALSNAGTYIWTPGNVFTNTFVVNATANYTVSSSNICGTTTQSIEVTAANVNASIGANQVSGASPLVVDFTNLSTGASSFSWIFGNGNSATTQTVSAQTYTNTGSYMVYLEVNNGFCFDTDSILIKVLDEEPTIIIPNVFTPNGDLVNDVFHVIARNITTFSCIIFDRWGLKLFAWNDVKQGWDGKVNSKLVPDGTYFYIMVANDINGKEIKKQGSINLFK
jgi:gliding motility-associated-like protein